MWPGLWIPRFWSVPRLVSSEYLLTVQSSQRSIRCLEAQVSTLQADLGARDSEIAELKLSLENAARTYSRQQNELTSKKIVAAQDAKISNLQWRLTQAADLAKTQKSTIENLKKAQRRPYVSIHSAFSFSSKVLTMLAQTYEEAVQTLPVVFADTTATTIVSAPAVEKAEFGVQVDEVPRHLVDASTQSVQHNSVLVDSATQTTDTLRVLVDFSTQVQEPPRQVKETAVQAAEPACVFADSNTQTDDPPPTVPAVEHEKALAELEELRRRLQDIESEREVVDVTQAEEEVHNQQKAHQQTDASVQFPNGGPKVSIQAFAVFLGAKLNQAFAPQVVDSMPEDEEEDHEEVEAEENLHDSSTEESGLPPVTDATAPIPNVSPDMYTAYEAIAGKKFAIPAHPDVNKLDQMPLRQWIMTALQRLYVDRVNKYSEITKSQASELNQGLNTAATQALGQGNHTLMMAMWQLAQAHTLSKMSPEEVVKGSPTPAYVTVDWKWKKPMDDDRVGQGFYKVCCTRCIGFDSDFNVFFSSNATSSTPSATRLPLILSSFLPLTLWSSRSLTPKGSMRTSRSPIGSRIRPTHRYAKPAFGSNTRPGCGLWMRT